MRRTRSLLFSVALMAIAALLAACSGGGSSPTNTPTGTPTSQAESGTIDVRVTDAPNPDVTAIVITASDIQVSQATASGSDDWTTVLAGQHTFDLLKVVGQEESLGVSVLPPGTYNQIRMTVDKAVITMGGQEVNAQVPSSELKIVKGFDVVAGETTILTFDFDANSSVVTAGPNVLLKPTVKLMVRKSTQPFVPANQETGTVTPTPTLPTPTPASTPAVSDFFLNVTAPVNTEAVVSTPSITVSGSTRVDAAVSINDTFVTPDANGNFSLDVPLTEGPNEIDVVASIASGDQLSKVLTVIYAP